MRIVNVCIICLWCHVTLNVSQQIIKKWFFRFPSVTYEKSCKICTCWLNFMVYEHVHTFARWYFLFDVQYYMQCEMWKVKIDNCSEKCSKDFSSLSSKNFAYTFYYCCKSFNILRAFLQIVELLKSIKQCETGNCCVKLSFIQNLRHWIHLKILLFYNAKRSFFLPKFKSEKTKFIICGKQWHWSAYFCGEKFLGTILFL